VLALIPARPTRPLPSVIRPSPGQRPGEAAGLGVQVTLVEAGGSPFISLRRGLSSLIEALRKACQNTAIHLGTPVAALRPAHGDAGFELTLADGRRLLADGVILATPAFAAGDLLEPLSPIAAAELRAIRYASAIVVVLAYGPDLSLPAGSGFLVAPGEPSLMAACSCWPAQAIAASACPIVSARGSPPPSGCLAGPSSYPMGWVQTTPVHVAGTSTSDQTAIAMELEATGLSVLLVEDETRSVAGLEHVQPDERAGVITQEPVPQTGLLAWCQQQHARVCPSGELSSASKSNRPRH
jgi:Flavin containing amine oxidoreductase